MSLSLEKWHERFQQQSTWTASLRAFLFAQIEIQKCSRILEVGSGTGVITESLHLLTEAKLFGLDLISDRGRFAATFDPRSSFVSADAYKIPYPQKSFDLTFCHYLLLWLKDPAAVICEMKRVTRPGGYVVALAEPDYLARIDAPESLKELGKMQTQSLLDQGARSDTGRRLPDYFSQAGLQNVQYGVSGFQIESGRLPAWHESEWQTLKSDLQDHIETSDLDRLQKMDHDAWLSGQRVLWIPTFYAIGSVI